MPKIVRLNWPTLNIALRMELDERNPELAEEFWNHLDFETIQDHGVVTGRIIYSWVPMVSLAPVRYKEMHTEAPIGRVFYTQSTGHKVIINYGVATETMSVPVLGKIVGDCRDALEKIGAAAWDSIYNTKELIPVTYSRAGA